MNEYEKTYLDNYDVLYKLMSLTAGLFDKDHVCTRKVPGMESKIMFNKFAGLPIITKKINIQNINSICIGDFVKNEKLSNYNEIELSGVEPLLEAFMNQNSSDNKINIFINSIKSMPNSVELWDPQTVNIDTYTENEHPVTQQYCNWYEFFEETYDIDYTNHFVVIITSSKMLPAYRKLYPHFIFCTQPVTSFQHIGLTRYTLITLAYYFNINRILCPEDNTVDLKTCSDAIENKQYTPCNNNINPAILLSELFSLEHIGTIDMSKVAYIGFDIGIPICNEEWEKCLVAGCCANDEIINVKIGNNNHLNISSRLYTKKAVKLKDITWSTFGTNPLPNPHRPKAIILNTKILKQHYINYNITHSIGEDISFTKTIYANSLSVLQLDIRIIFPGDSRRPILDLTKIDHRCRFLVPETIIELNNNFFIETSCDLIMLEGKIIYFDQNGIYAGSGVYGPMRVITKDDYQLVINKLNNTHNKDNHDRYVGKGRIHSPKNYEVYHINTSKYDYELPNMTEKNRIDNINKYIIVPQKDLEIYENTVRRLIENNIVLYDFASKNNGIIYRSGGQQKYLLRYEYLNHILHVNFSELCKKKTFLPLIQTIFKKIVASFHDVATDPKDAILLIDDLFFYLRNYDLFPTDIYKLITILCLYTKYIKLINLINNKTILSKKQFDLTIFMFGNINSSFYKYYEISDLCNSVINLILNQSQEINNEWRIDDKSGLISKHIDNIYKKLI